MNTKTSKTLERVERMLNMSNDVLNDLDIEESTNRRKNTNPRATHNRYTGNSRANNFTSNRPKTRRKAL